MNRHEFRMASEAIERWPLLTAEVYISLRIIQRFGYNPGVRHRLMSAIVPLLDGFPRFDPIIRKYRHFLFRVTLGPYEVSAGRYLRSVHGVMIARINELVDDISKGGKWDSVRADFDSADWGAIARRITWQFPFIIAGFAPSELACRIAIEREKAIGAMYDDELVELLARERGQVRYQKTSRTSLATFFGVNRSTITRWLDRGLIQINPDQLPEMRKDVLEVDSQWYEYIEELPKEDRRAYVGGRPCIKKRGKCKSQTENGL